MEVLTDWCQLFLRYSSSGTTPGLAVFGRKRQRECLASRMAFQNGRDTHHTNRALVVIDKGLIGAFSGGVYYFLVFGKEFQEVDQARRVVAVDLPSAVIAFN